jgi:integrase
MTVNPCGLQPGHRTKGLPKVERTAAVYLSVTEAELIIACCRPEIRDLVRFAFATGLRLGELIALRVGSVDLADTPDGQTVIHVELSRKKSGRVGGPKTEAGDRVVAITSTITNEVLRPHVSGRPSVAPVFPAPEGGMWYARNLRERYWRPALVKAARCAEHPPAPEGKPTPPDADPKLRCGHYGGTRTDGGPCGFKVAQGLDRCLWHLGPAKDAISACECPGRLHVLPRLHDTRHSHVDFLLDADWDLYDVQIHIGHEHFSTTSEMYGNRRRRIKRDKMKALDGVLTGSGGAA